MSPAQISHPKATVTWYTRDEELGSGDQLSFVPSYTHNNTNLVCDARNTKGHARIQTRLLLKDLEIINQVDYIEIAEGADLALECEAVGMEPITYEWRSAKGRLSENSTAILRHVTRNSPDALTCAVCSPLGCLKHTVTIFVKGVPKTLSPPFVGKLNETHLLISWEHREEVTYTFYFLVGGTAPQISRDLVKNETIIRRRDGLKEVRLGVSARNEYGESPVSYTWPPFSRFIPAPRNLHIRDLTETSVEVGWDGTECESYLITVANSSTNFTLTAPHSPTTPTHVLLIDSLAPWSRYSVVVVPRAQGSSGPSSNTVVVQTLASETEHAVEDLSAQILSVSEVFLSWNPPAMEESNGFLEGFEVTSLMLDDDDEITSGHSESGSPGKWKRQALQTVGLGYAARSYLKRNLKPKKKYKFTIVAVVTAGRSPAADISVDTKYDKFVVPDGVGARMTGPGNMTVYWSALPGASYDVKYWGLGGTATEKNITVSDTSHALVSYPEDVTVMQVQVGKVYRGKVYNYSEILTISSVSDKALAVNLTVRHRNADQVDINWSLTDEVESAVLTVYPVILGSYDFEEDLWEQLNNTNHSNVKMIVDDDGSITVNISTKMVLYEAMIRYSYKYPGTEQSSRKYWYMRQDVSAIQSLWFRYILLIACCAAFLGAMWGGLLYRASIINKREGTKSKRKLRAQNTFSTTVS